MAHRTHHSREGATIVEIVVVLAVIVIIGVIIAAFGRDFFRLNASFEQSLLNQRLAKEAIEQMVKEIRQAGPSENGAYAIAIAEDNNFIFYSNADTDLDRERVRYFLEGGALKKGVIKAAGTPPAYDPAQEILKTLVSDAAPTTTPLFIYYDKDYAGTTSPLSIPVDVSAVRLLKITLPVDRDPNALPEPLVAAGQVFIRNLKDN